MCSSDLVLTADTYGTAKEACLDLPVKIQTFPNENVLPAKMAVVEELDGLKRAAGERGANARAAIRGLEELRARGDLLSGVALAGGGILRVEKFDPDTGEAVLTVGEDLDCSGLPITGETVCNYDEGFLAGVLKVYTQKEYVVTEVDCWATGSRVCRFEASVKSQESEQNG